MSINEIEFLSPLYFTLIGLVPILILLFYLKKQKKSLNFIFYEDIKQIFKHNTILFYLKIFFVCIVIISFSFLLANPNTSNKTEKITKNGIDIVMIIDISESMNANDLSPNRLESAKKIIIDFIKKQETNRLGLVLFAGKPFQSIPLTFDYNIFTQITERISTANINQNYPELSGTAIGDALLMGSTLFDLENQKEKDREKVIILLTDGEANKGAEPKIVAKYLNEKGIKIYTVGIGSLEGGEITYDDGFFKQSYFVEPLNEKDLLEITKITKGEYFRAIDNKSLENIFEKLEKLEKKDIEMETKKEFTTNYSFFSYLLIFSLIILMSLLIYNPEE